MQKSPPGLAGFSLSSIDPAFTAGSREPVLREQGSPVLALPGPASRALRPVALQPAEWPARRAALRVPRVRSRVPLRSAR